MSESMIERVGRALANEEGYAYDPVPYDRRARAAIEAMREPSDDFLSFIAHAHDIRPQDWSEIIDAALNPQTSP